MESKIDPAELTVTRELLKDFSAKPNLTAEEVYRKSWSRYQILENIPFHEMTTGNWKVKLLKVVIYEKLPEILHYFMYDELYTFAGQYRRISDPNKGKIYFGPQHAHQRKPIFSGDLPENIEDGIGEAVLHLRKWVRDPIYRAVRFYQKFVNVHPFYDGNGRVARIIANTYLNSHGLTIAWSEFDNKGKFIHKLNYCHRNPNEETYLLLTNYIKDYTFKLKDLES